MPCPMLLLPQAQHVAILILGLTNYTSSAEPILHVSRQQMSSGGAMLCCSPRFRSCLHSASASASPNPI